MKAAALRVLPVDACAELRQRRDEPWYRPLYRCIVRDGSRAFERDRSHRGFGIDGTHPWSGRTGMYRSSVVPRHPRANAVPVLEAARTGEGMMAPSSRRGGRQTDGCRLTSWGEEVILQDKHGSHTQQLAHR